jgi:hypothetical protein
MIRGPQLSDQGMQAYNPRPRPPVIKAAPAKLTYDSPQVNTYSPNTGWSAPVGNYQPAPANNWAQTTWNGPAQSIAPAVTSISPATDAATSQAKAQTATKSADDFANQYKGHDDQLAQVDSAFMDQKSMYADLLKKYLADYTVQKGGVEKDAATAIDGVNLNQNRGLTSLNEDFAARGLGRSGLQAKEHGDATTAYGRQRSNITTGMDRSIGDLNFRKSKFEGENGENGSNIQTARREAYARLVSKQNLT